MAPEAPSGVTLFFRVTDLTATLGRAMELGARVVVPVRRTGEDGAHFAIIETPARLSVGIVQA